MLKYFHPQHDITAYELAYIWRHTGIRGGEPISQTGVEFTHQHWATTPEQIRRHFTDTK